MQTRGGGEKLTLTLAEHLSLNHNVCLFHLGELNRRSLEQSFAVDLSRVRLRSLNDAGLPLKAAAKLRQYRTPPFSLHHYLQLKKLNMDLFINTSYASSLACPAPKGIFVCLFPHELGPPHDKNGLLQRASRSLTNSIEKGLTRFDGQTWPASYSKVVAISRYSADWIARFWGLQPEIVFPPCEDMGPPSQKEKIILHVGRFTAPQSEMVGHHKAQNVLLQAFREMKEVHRQGWELHLVGNIGRDNNSAQLAARLRQDAEALPIKFHFNAPFNELRDFYRRAAIYWHATGFGFDSEIYPARQEHFGITTVEAMSAGAVPLVNGSGGQKEIVTHGTDGLYWNDIPDLANQTLALVNNPDQRTRLAQQAGLSSRRFRREVFLADMERVIDQLRITEPR